MVVEDSSRWRQQAGEGGMDGEAEDLQAKQVRVAWMGRLRTYRTLLRKVERLP